MKILNEDGPYLMWFTTAIGYEDLPVKYMLGDAAIPPQHVDFCPDCAEKLLKKIHETHGLTNDDVWIEGDSDITMSNESDVENVCAECDAGLYTELRGDE